MGAIRTLVHCASGNFEEGLELDAISSLLPEAGNLLWLDLVDPTADDVELLRREFGFHPLALEDVVKRHQRPKIEQYGDYSFLVLYAVRGFSLSEISLFVGPNYLVTIRHGEVPEIAETATRWRANAAKIEPGVGVLVYSLLDAVVDNYFPLVDQIADRLEDLEQAIFAGRQPNGLADVFQLKKELLRLRRALAPTRDVVNVLARRDTPMFGEHTLAYFQDVYDHTVRVLDSIDLYRDQLSSLLDAHLTLVSNRLNSVMKKMTALATILMSVTLISSIYGMNFEQMPEIRWALGYPFALILMAAIGFGLAYLFRRADWL